MGELEGARNAWAYVEGGMGSVSMAIARAAESYGATLHTESVSQHLDLLSKVHRAHQGRLTDSLHIAPLQNVCMPAWNVVVACVFDNYMMVLLFPSNFHQFSYFKVGSDTFT